MVAPTVTPNDTQTRLHKPTQRPTILADELKGYWPERTKRGFHRSRSFIKGTDPESRKKRQKWHKERSDSRANVHVRELQEDDDHAALHLPVLRLVQGKEGNYRKRYVGGHFFSAPKWVLYNTSISSHAKVILQMLYDNAIVVEIKERPRLVCDGLNQYFFAEHMDVSLATVNRAIGELRRLKLVKPQRMPQKRNKQGQFMNNSPYRYFLATNEPAHLKYPAASRHSSVRRVENFYRRTCKAFGMEDIPPIDWDNVTKYPVFMPGYGVMWTTEPFNPTPKRQRRSKKNAAPETNTGQPFSGPRWLGDLLNNSPP